MCYIAVFVPGMSGVDSCVVVAGPPVGDGGASGDGGTCTAPANSLGIGAACQPNAGSCASGLSCSSDLQGTSAPGFCMKIGCTGASDCGSDATCCSPAQSGGAVNVCLPSACVPSDCTVKP
jgi:hypothetical protein